MRTVLFLFAVLMLTPITYANSTVAYGNSGLDTTISANNSYNSSGKVSIGSMSSSPSGVGVGSKASGSSGLAVKAEATGSNSKGVQATSTGSAGIGVDGTASGSGNTIGVRGTGKTGVVAAGVDLGLEATASSSTGTAVSASGGDIGVNAYGNEFGVMGYGSDAGVFGYSDVVAGVLGSSYSADGIHATSTNGRGINAVSANDLGLRAEGVNGVEAYATGSYATGAYGNGPTGVAGVSYGSGGYSDAIGVNAYTYNNNASSTFGLYAQAVYGDYTYGVYASATAGNYATWAGYFDGDVYVGGYFDNPSDIVFKKNIRPMQGSLAKIMALKPKNYDMKVDEFKDRIVLPKGNQYGLIAQELESVFPELVHATAAPARLTPEERKKGVKKDPTKFKSVNYMALIPILVQAIQEQQAEIEALKRGR